MQRATKAAVLALMLTLAVGVSAACSSDSTDTSVSPDSNGPQAASTVADIADIADIADAAARPAAGRTPLAGFDERAFRFVRSNKPITDWFCGLLATTDAAREQGLMNQVDLRGYDAMLFEWPQDVSFGFWMKDTLIPLDIAWYDASGAEVSRAAMQPCPTSTTDCPIYDPNGPYRTALETDLGHLIELGAAADEPPALEVAKACVASAS